MTQFDAYEVLAGGGEMGQLMRSIDWSRTALGPLEGWPQSLRTTVSTCLNSRFPILIWWGREMVKLYNDAYRPMLGDKHPKSMGARGRDVWPEIWPIIGPMLEGVLREGKATWSENQLLLLERHGFAEECYFTYSYSPIRDESGGIGGIYCAVTETTGTVLGERRLRTLRDLAAHTAGAKSSVDACRLATAALSENPHDLPFVLLYLVDRREARLASATGIDGVPRAGAVEEIAGTKSLLIEDLEQRFGDVRYGDGAPRPKSALAMSISLPGEAHPSALMIAGISPQLELDEKYRTFLELVAGQVETAIASARSLEDAELRAEALAQIDRAKTIFFSNVSHEFRTPLTLMLGPTSDLLAGAHGQLTPPQRAQLELLRRNELRLQRLVNALLEFSRIEAGRIRASYEPVDLARLTRELASSFRSAVERAGLDFLIDCPPLGEPVFVDHDMWEQIVLNLLSNAFKFTFEGQIKISLCSEEDSVVLSVSDTGIGVAEDEVPRLFERFHRIEGTRARTHEGSGIGLALVQELVRLHGGSIRAESRLGEGTTFTLAIPKGSAHLPADRIRARRTQATVSPGASAFVDEASRWLPADTLLERDEVSQPTVIASSIQAARILVADDNADMRDYLERILGSHWRIESVGDGVAALEAARAHRPDLVLTDVMMPSLDGFGLLRQLRAEPATSSIPVIMLSARAGEESRVEGLQAGADDYLVKPFSARELVARVRTHLDLARLRAETRAQYEQLTRLFLQAPVAICVLRGADLAIEFANPACLEIVRNRDVVGKPLLEAVPEIRGKGYDDLCREVMRTGEPWIAKEIFAPLDRDNDGVLEDSYFSLSAVGIRNDGGVIDRVMVVVTEVTEDVLGRHRAEDAQREIVRSEVEARRALTLRDEFLVVASHEIRTPLTTIGLQADGLLRSLRELPSTPIVERSIRRAEKVRREASRLEERMEETFDIFSLSKKELELEVEELDLAEVARAVVERLRRESSAARVICIRTEPVVGRWDRRRLDQILSQLVSNALKFGEGKPIDVIVSGTATSARVGIIDRGIGVDPLEQERIFGRFERGVSSMHYGGFGLGLWIVRELVQKMGGTILVESRLKEGATFTVELPRYA